ncbi:MAG TPA: precorrin-6A reductase [Desulfomonilaceae bacterium]|nr:precorrin-6A reductase [Desulfomonilaceae bacterium]
MILFLGGTSETAPLAEALAEAGFTMLVSTATDIPLDVGNHPLISRRCGRLDRDSMSRLAAESGITAIVDASHPYASDVHATARDVANSLKIPYFVWIRPAGLSNEDFVCLALDHAEAARIAFSFGSPVLLTTGSKNLIPYASESARTGVPLIARVLNHPESVEACRSAGIPPHHILTGKGPFSLEQNLMAIRMFHIKVIVTKDSGLPGGIAEKAEAARLTDCRLVVVQRPEITDAQGFNDVSELISAVKKSLSGPQVRSRE